MNLLKMPPYDLADVNALSVARAEHSRAGRALGRAELRAAAAILRKLWGKPAVRLIVRKETSDQDETEITALALFHERGHLMWFSYDDDVVYPGADDISDLDGRPTSDMDNEVVAAIEVHLQDAYNAMGGSGGALEPVRNKHLGSPEANLLELDIDVALMTDQAPQRRLGHVMYALKRRGARAARLGQPAPTDDQLWEWAHQADRDAFPVSSLQERRDSYETPDEGVVDDDWIEQLRTAFNQGRNATA